MVAKKTKNVILALGLAAFGIGGALFPYLYATSRTRKPLTSSETPLSGQATMRGAYMNTGSRDIGPSKPRSLPVQKKTSAMYNSEYNSLCTSDTSWRLLVSLLFQYLPSLLELLSLEKYEPSTNNNALKDSKPNVLPRISKQIP